MVHIYIPEHTVKLISLDVISLIPSVFVNTDSAWVTVCQLSPTKLPPLFRSTWFPQIPSWLKYPMWSWLTRDTGYLLSSFYRCMKRDLGSPHLEIPSLMYLTMFGHSISSPMNLDLVRPLKGLTCLLYLPVLMYQSPRWINCGMQFDISLQSLQFFCLGLSRSEMNWVRWAVSFIVNNTINRIILYVVFS